METIEIGAVKVRQGNVIDTFETFVRPEYVDKLTPFCTELTGLTFADLENAPTFNRAILGFYKFIYDFDIYSCGDFDRKFLMRELEEKGFSSEHELARNAIHSSHRDLKVHFNRVTDKRKQGMLGMASVLGIEIKGTHHRALSDSLNLANIYLKLEEIRASHIAKKFTEKALDNLVNGLNSNHDLNIMRDKDLYVIGKEKYSLIELIDLMNDVILTDMGVRGLSYLSPQNLSILNKYVDKSTFIH